MVAEVFGGIGAFKAMFDMAKGLKDINDTTIRNGAVIELQEQILAAQVEQAALLERIGFLEKEMARLETWDTEKQKYELKEVCSGAVAYALKEDGNLPSPMHYLCANCFENRFKSYLIATTRFPGRCEVLECHRCGSDIYRVGGWESAHATRQKRQR